MSVEQLSALILGITGVLIQLIFKYVPKIKDWYEAQENKGTIMLGVVFVVSAVYFALGCSPWAVLLKISLTCDTPGLFALLQAFFIIATTQQLTYLYTRRSVK